MSKHTPGPWFVEKGKKKQEWYISTNERDPILGYMSWTGLAVVYGCNDDRRNGKIVGKANAALIAAAPELLEALVDIVENGIGTAAINRARAAIAKAKGEMK